MMKRDYVVITMFLLWMAYCIWVKAYPLLIFVPLILLFDFLLWGIVRRVQEQLRGSLGKVKKC